MIDKTDIFYHNSSLIWTGKQTLVRVKRPVYGQTEYIKTNNTNKTVTKKKRIIRIKPIKPIKPIIRIKPIKPIIRIKRILLKQGFTDYWCIYYALVYQTLSISIITEVQMYIFWSNMVDQVILDDRSLTESFEYVLVIIGKYIEHYCTIVYFLITINFSFSCF